MGLDLPDLFEGVNAVDAASATRRFERRPLRAGEVVLAAGAPGDKVVGVLRGTLEVRAGDVVLARIGAGQLVGELALFESSRHTAEVRAHVDSEIALLSRAGYEELRDTAHPVAANLEQVAMRHQARRLRETDDRIGRLSEGVAAPIRLPGQAFFSQVAAQFGRGGLFHPSEVDRVSALARSGLFEDVPLRILQELGARFGVSACGPGHLLCTQGTVGRELWVVESGEVDVLVSTRADDVQVLATVGPGALMGAGALVETLPRMASCVARTRVVALLLDGSSWSELSADATLLGSALRRAVIRSFAVQLAGANELLHRFEEHRVVGDLEAARSALVATPAPEQ